MSENEFEDFNNEQVDMEANSDDDGEEFITPSKVSWKISEKH